MAAQTPSPLSTNLQTLTVRKISNPFILERAPHDVSFVVSPTQTQQLILNDPKTRFTAHFLVRNSTANWTLSCPGDSDYIVYLHREGIDVETQCSL